MKRTTVCSLLLISGLFASRASGQQRTPPPAKAFSTAPEISYDSAPNFLKMPNGMYLGEGIGVARNSKGDVFVYTRGGDTSHLFEFDPKGAFVREIGVGLYGFQMAHGVRIDPQDNIWVIDEGTDMIIKFTPDGRVAMTMGRRPEFGGGLKVTPAFNAPVPPALPYRFGRPTDVAWDSAGDIFVSDGYTNSRVVKYDKEGRFIKDVGTKGTEPLQFNTPHSIQTDANGNVYVADRGNRRIQVLTSDLALKAVYDNVGAPWAVCITPGPHQYLYSSNSYPDNNNSLNAAVSGEIYKMELDGTVVGKFGKAGKQMKEFATVHAMDCRNDNEILTAEITAWRVQKITLRPQTQMSFK
ncbi:MAG TPA: peptidyl-alpha-hydroxyglycine alpha-amidating lyase family protein [Candidatus Acidoferrales bacterium]